MAKAISIVAICLMMMAAGVFLGDRVEETRQARGDGATTVLGESFPGDQ